jgi:hypothetical protein
MTETAQGSSEVRCPKCHRLIYCESSLLWEFAHGHTTIRIRKVIPFLPVQFVCGNCGTAVDRTWDT